MLRIGVAHKRGVSFPVALNQDDMEYVVRMHLRIPPDARISVTDAATGAAVNLRQREALRAGMRLVVERLPDEPGQPRMGAAAASAALVATAQPPLKLHSLPPLSFMPLPRMPILGHGLYLKKSIIRSELFDYDKVGTIFQATVPTLKLFMTVDPDVCLDIFSRPGDFDKVVPRPRSSLMLFALLRNFTAAGSGLFTTSTTDPEWELGHRILMPSFGLRNIRTFFPVISERVERLVTVLGSNPSPPRPIDFYFTCLTLDTIAQCAFNVDFNSLGSTEPNQFIKDMVFQLSCE
jgi:hypothetical protein